MKNKIIKVILRMLLVFFVAFGIFFVALLGHEGIHVYQSKKPISICYNYQDNNLMHVEHNNTFYNESQWEAFVDYTEKCAHIFEYIFIILISGFIGFMSTKIYYDKKEKL